MSNMSNRYPDMLPVDVIAGPTYLVDHIHCPLCNAITYASGLGGEVGYHGSKNGALLCEGSGYKIREILPACDYSECILPHGHIESCRITWDKNIPRCEACDPTPEGDDFDCCPSCLCDSRDCVCRL